MYAHTIEKWAALRRAKGKSPRGIIVATREMLGLHPDPAVCYHYNERGQPCLVKPSMNASHMSLEAMAIGVLEGSTPGRGYERFRQIFGKGRSARVLEETAPIDPTNFSDINAFVGMASGLVEVKILEAYTLATQVAMELVEVEPSNVMGQRKIIGIGSGGLQALKRLPGEQHPRATLGQKYVTVPDSSERALAIDLTKEAVRADLTSDLVNRAADIGTWVGYAQANMIYAHWLGILGGWIFNGTTYNAYQTTSGGETAMNNYVNKIVNPMSDSLNMFQASDKQFSLMSAPPPPIDHGQRIVINPNMIVTSVGRQKRFASILGATQIRIGDGAAGTVAVYAPNPMSGSGTTVLASPNLDKMITDAVVVTPTNENPGGLGLSGDAADGMWWYGQKGALKLSVIQPLSVVAAPADNYMMLDQGIVASYFADERSIPYWMEPRKVVWNLDS